MNNLEQDWVLDIKKLVLVPPVNVHRSLRVMLTNWRKKEKWEQIPAMIFCFHVPRKTAGYSSHVEYSVTWKDISGRCKGLNPNCLFFEEVMGKKALKNMREVTGDCLFTASLMDEGDTPALIGAICPDGSSRLWLSENIEKYDEVKKKLGPFLEYAGFYQKRRRRVASSFKQPGCYRSDTDTRNFHAGLGCIGQAGGQAVSFELAAKTGAGAMCGF